MKHMGLQYDFATRCHETDDHDADADAGGGGGGDDDGTDDLVNRLIPSSQKFLNPSLYARQIRISPCKHAETHESSGCDSVCGSEHTLRARSKCTEFKPPDWVQWGTVIFSFRNDKQHFWSSTWDRSHSPPSPMGLEVHQQHWRNHLLPGGSSSLRFCGSKSFTNQMKTLNKILKSETKWRKEGKTANGAIHRCWPITSSFNSKHNISRPSTGANMTSPASPAPKRKPTKPKVHLGLSLRPMRSNHQHLTRDSDRIFTSTLDGSGPHANLCKEN